ncbi:MAG TPA: OmpA family protein [Thermoanaerobaculia bacterium]|nr:OmpA family protein [Thermoanaerobaculia bacterium]HUM30278.1 OmpA family protein [Thermoanaerobaculia bacterium]HXK68426.1 OmpA family protein [Thermoanaerobaculia bacterium]
MKRFSVVFLAMLACFAALYLVAGEVKEHPLVRPFPGSTLNDNVCHYADFDEYSFRIVDSDTGKEVKIPVRGKYWQLLYTLYTPDNKWDKSHSVVELKENYKAAALEKGGEVRLDRGNDLIFTLPGEDGRRTWVHLWVTNGAQQNLRIIEESGFKKSLTFGSVEMKEALDVDGHVSLNDIFFDVDKATLKVESTKQLQDVVTLMKTNPELVLEVQGHTDDQGSTDYNLTLSQKRAEAVVSYLKLFGIDQERLTPKGYGESRPVMPNASEEGRARNRRVELVKE